MSGLNTSSVARLDGRTLNPLESLISSKTARIGVVGLGYVGLPLAVEYASAGYVTVGIDLETDKVDAVTQGKNYIADVEANRLAAVVRSGKLTAKSDYDSVGSLDIIFICVPTPFTPSKDPDISAVLSAAKEIASRLRQKQLIILRSTTFPGTTEAYVRPILEEKGLIAGRDFYLAFSPERIDPGNKSWSTTNTPVLVGGITPECTRLAALSLQQIVPHIVPVGSPKIAEMAKLLENVFRSVNIALVNELAQLCDRIGGLNMWEVIDAASSKPFGFMPFYPGPGIGGHCILVDPFYLSWLARQHDFQTKFITLAAETNELMPFYVKNMVLREISMMPVSLREAKIVILGVAFKKNTDDVRHSPAVKILQLLLSDGARNLWYSDPYVPQLSVDSQTMESITLDEELLRSSDCVLIIADHSSFDYEMIVRHARRIVDTRNATKGFPFGREKIVVLGDGA